MTATMLSRRRNRGWELCLPFLLLLVLQPRRALAASTVARNTTLECDSGGVSTDGRIICGPQTPLIMVLELPGSFSTTTTMSDVVCVLQGSVALTDPTAHFTSSPSTSSQYATLEISASLPASSASLTDMENFGSDASDDGVELRCNVTLSAESDAVTEVSASLPSFVYLSDDAWAITDMTLASGAGIAGADDTAQLSLQVNGSNPAQRQASLSGVCVLNGQQCDVESGQLRYRVQLNDSDAENSGLTYNCSILDGAGNALQQRGVLQHQPPQLDGREPILETVVLLFSTSKPARVGSVISVTLRAKELRTSLSGNCTVNNAMETSPLLETEDAGFYVTQYTVAEGDRSVTPDDDSIMPLRCIVANTAGQARVFEANVTLGFNVDAQPPRITSTTLLFSSDTPAHEGSVIEIHVGLEQDEPSLHIPSPQDTNCLINNVSVANSFSRAAANAFMLTYVVGSEPARWKAGQLPLHCVVRDAAGNTATVSSFTDGNTLFARELKPETLAPEAFVARVNLPDKLLLLTFLLVAVASHALSKLFPLVGLPRITGYLATGVIAGPYVLVLLSSDQLRRLRVLDELALAYIGLAAGSKLHWRQMRPLLCSIAVVTLALTVVEYVVGTLTIVVLSGLLDFLQSTSDAERYAIALLAGCMMVARSPSSALAVIEETRAHGRFTTLCFAVTVCCDVLVILLFNVNSMVTESFLSAKRVDARDVLRLALQLCGSLGLGAVLGKLMALLVLFRPRCVTRKRRMLLRVVQTVKQLLLLVYGGLVFALGHAAHPYLEPLLCCMVSGAVMWNCSSRPDELALLLSGLAEPVYVCFFTLTGAALELDMLAQALVLALVLCVTRAAAIFVGSLFGGLCAGESPRHARVAWMAYLTQAGVTLGLAKQTQLLYPGWGGYFSTLIVAVVICNQLVGPPLLRYVLRLVGDAQPPASPGCVPGLQALVLTSQHADERCSARVDSAVSRMELCGWVVHVQPLQPSALDPNEEENDDIDTNIAAQIGEALERLEPLAVAVVLLPSDAENLRVLRVLASACQRAKRVNVLRVVVQVVGNDNSDLTGGQSWADAFAGVAANDPHGDSIDVVVVDRREAAELLVELAANGTVLHPKGSVGSESAVVDTQQMENELVRKKRHVQHV